MLAEEIGMEELMAYALLWANGFVSYEKYNTLLDEKFLENPKNINLSAGRDLPESNFIW